MTTFFRVGVDVLGLMEYAVKVQRVQGLGSFALVFNISEVRGFGRKIWVYCAWFSSEIQGYKAHIKGVWGGEFTLQGLQ